MAVKRDKVERIGMGLVLCIALLMFYGPLVVLHGAFSGDESINALRIRSTLSQLRSGIETSSGFSTDQSVFPDVQGENPSTEKPLNLRFILSIGWLVPLSIFVALFYAALALIDLLFLRRAAGALSLLGGCCAALAIVLLLMLNSGIQSWTAELVQNAPLRSGEDISAAMRLLMAHAFQVSPGPGLYVLASCLLLVAALSYSRAIPRMERVVRRSPRSEGPQSVRIRPIDSRFPEETCVTRNYSQHGLYLVTEAAHYYAGMEVSLIRTPDAPGSQPREERGSVVRVDKSDSGKSGVAIRIISAPA
jgi:hypothetical protein